MILIKTINNYERKKMKLNYVKKLDKILSDCGYVHTYAEVSGLDEDYKILKDGTCVFKDYTLTKEEYQRERLKLLDIYKHEKELTRYL